MWQTIKSIYGLPASEVYWIGFFQMLWLMVSLMFIPTLLWWVWAANLSLVAFVDLLFCYYPSWVFAICVWHDGLIRNFKRNIGRMLFYSILYWLTIWGYYVQLRGMSFSFTTASSANTLNIVNVSLACGWLACLIGFGAAQYTTKKLEL